MLKGNIRCLFPLFALAACMSSIFTLEISVNLFLFIEIAILLISTIIFWKSGYQSSLTGIGIILSFVLFVGIIIVIIGTKAFGTSTALVHDLLLNAVPYVAVTFAVLQGIFVRKNWELR